MDSEKGISIIEQMLFQTRKSVHRIAPYFVVWGSALTLTGVLEFFLRGVANAWLVWPIVSILGGVFSGIYSKKEDKRTGVETKMDRMVMYTWAGFGIALLYVIVFALYNGFLPHGLILLQAGLATFVTAGITKYRIFFWGALALLLGAVCIGFITPAKFTSLIFATSILLGYLIPGIIVKNKENG